jgi:hypothetical protein
MGCGISAPEMKAGPKGDNPRVFFDISIDDKPKGRIIMELRAGKYKHFDDTIVQNDQALTHLTHLISFHCRYCAQDCRGEIFF